MLVASDGCVPRATMTGMTKTELHELVECLPENTLDRAAVLLRGLSDGRIDPDQAARACPPIPAGTLAAHLTCAALARKARERPLPTEGSPPSHPTSHRRPLDGPRPVGTGRSDPSAASLGVYGGKVL